MQPDYIVESLWPLVIRVDTCHLDPANARTGHAVDKIAASLAAYKQRKPIVVNASEGMKIEAGNGTYQAAVALGWTHIAAVIVEDDGATAVGYAIADNRLGDLSKWDGEVLAQLLGSLDEDVVTGFEAGDLEALLAEMDIEVDLPAREDAEPRIDAAAALREAWGTAVGQLWRLPSRIEGQCHLLICGDCTDAAVVMRLMGDAVADIMVTDPPYGVEYDPAWRADLGINKNTKKLGRVENDDRADWAEAWQLFEGNIAYVYHAGAKSGIVQRSLETAGFDIRAQIIWVKDKFALGRGDYHWKHEPCWYAVRSGESGRRNDDRTQTTVWEIGAREDGGNGHGTQKPLEAMMRPISNHENINLVYEPFCGSGTTIIAAENLGRQCRAVELQPEYLAVALERYVDAFGIRGELVNE